LFEGDPPPVFVILDVGLPDESGFDLCREFRRSSEIPILFLTAREGEIDRVVGLELGADDYVTKPFSPRELVARVRAILRRTQGAGAANANSPSREDSSLTSGRMDGFEIDEARRQIRFEGQLLTLTRYEYGMLLLFLAHPGRVFTRDQLMDHVWEEPESSLDRTVDAHVKSLRAKLRAIDEEAEVIVTHRGVGYSLREER
ncbi:MAG: winged helix-turn-helix domain-containing protein, partial [Verrucomicrobiota bacterium]